MIIPMQIKSNPDLASEQISQKLKQMGDKLSNLKMKNLKAGLHWRFLLNFSQSFSKLCNMWEEAITKTFTLNFDLISHSKSLLLVLMSHR